MRQRGRVVKSVVIVIDMVYVQNLLASCCCALNKDGLRHIFLLGYLSNQEFQVDSNILVSPKAGRSNCLFYVLCLCRFPVSQQDKCRDEIKCRLQRIQVFIYCPVIELVTVLNTRVIVSTHLKPDLEFIIKYFSKGKSKSLEIDKALNFRFSAHKSDC